MTDNLLEQVLGFTQAPAEIEGKFLDPRGNVVSITLRADSENSLIDRWLLLNQKLNNMGFKLVGTKAEATWQVPPTQKQPPANGAEKSFSVDSVSLASGGDHPRWVIKGGNFKKFGVTCWPETLEECGMMPHLDPLKDNAPKASWTAFYVEKMNEEGKPVPDKVTRLVKA